MESESPNRVVFAAELSPKRTRGSPTPVLIRRDRSGPTTQKLLHPDPGHLVFNLAVIACLEPVLFLQPRTAALLQQLLFNFNPCRFLAPAGRGGQ